MKTGEIAVFAGWLLCIISLVSVGRHSAADFQGIGQSRRRWAWISLLGIIPSLGIFTSVAYFFAVSRSFPEKERAPGPAQPPRAPQGRPRPKCGRCGGNKWEKTATVAASRPASTATAAAGYAASAAMARGYSQGSSPGSTGRSYEPACAASPAGAHPWRSRSILPPPVACAPALVHASANATTIPTGMKPVSSFAAYLSRSHCPLGDTKGRAPPPSHFNNLGDRCRTRATPHR